MFGSVVDLKTKALMHDHTERFIAIAPIVFMTKINQIALEWLSKIANTLDDLALNLHIYEIGSIDCFSFNGQLSNWDIISLYQCEKNNFLCSRNDLNIDSFIPGWLRPNKVRT